MRVSLIEMLQSDIQASGVVKINQMPTEVITYIFVCIGLMGLPGNVMVYTVTRHPKLKRCSYRVYLAYLAVVDSLDIILIIVFTMNDHLSMDREIVAVSDGLCKLLNGLRLWMNHMATIGLLGLAADRYAYSAVTCLKMFMCTIIKARLVCVTLSLLTAILTLPEMSTFLVTSYGNMSVCVENIMSAQDHALVIITLIAPSAICLYITVHSLVYFFCTRRKEDGRNSDDSNRSNTDRATLGPLLALTSVSLLTRLPLVVYEPLANMAGFSIMDSPSDEPNTFHISIVKAKDIIAVVMCISLSCKFYVLVTTCALFRRYLWQILRRVDLSNPEERVIQLPGDRRVLTAIAEGQVLESISGQVVDIHRYNVQRERRQVTAQLSTTDSVYSVASYETVVDETSTGNKGLSSHIDSGPWDADNSGTSPAILDSIGEAQEQREEPEDREIQVAMDHDLRAPAASERD